MTIMIELFMDYILNNMNNYISLIKFIVLMNFWVALLCKLSVSYAR